MTKRFESNTSQSNWLAAIGRPSRKGNLVRHQKRPAMLRDSSRGIQHSQEPTTSSVPPGATRRSTLAMAWRRGGSGNAWTVMTSATRSKPCIHLAGRSRRSAVT